MRHRSSAVDLRIDGKHCPVVVRRWDPVRPRWVVLIAHGYGEHSGRYEHVARALVNAGAVVYAPDHYAHGRTAAGKDLAAFDDLSDMVDDLACVASVARDAHSGLPVALIGHSMGGIIATRYAQTLDGSPLDALVLSGPPIGGNQRLQAVLTMDPIPDIPLDPGGLSRDPSVGEDYAADPLVYHGPFQRRTVLAMLTAVNAIRTGPRLDALPILWIHGELDPLAQVDVTRPAVESLSQEHLEKRIYSGAMHEVFNEINRDEVLADVVAFLSRVLPSPKPGTGSGPPDGH